MATVVIPDPAQIVNLSMGSAQHYRGHTISPVFNDDEGQWGAVIAHRGVYRHTVAAPPGWIGRAHALVAARAWVDQRGASGRRER